MAVHIQSTSGERTRPGDIVSRCGLLCNTCSAYLTGACPGCPSLPTGECVLRDCAERKGTTCLDCTATSCYHFEAYTWRRKAMNRVVKHYLRLTQPEGREMSAGPGCGSAGGCGGCSLKESGCPAARFAETLAAM